MSEESPKHNNRLPECLSKLDHNQVKDLCDFLAVFDQRTLDFAAEFRVSKKIQKRPVE